MTNDKALEQTVEIRALSGDEIDNVAGAGIWDWVKKGVEWAVGHPEQTVSGARKVINWIRGWF